MKNMIAVYLLIWFLPCMSQQDALIAYNVLADQTHKNYEIYTMRLDGSNPTNLTNSESIDWVYYTHANKIYFLSDRGQCHRCFYLYEMTSDGKNLRRLTDFKVADSWMDGRNKGQQIIIKPVTEKNNFFYIINTQTQSMAEVIDQKIEINMAYINDPSFSPDGKSIVFRGAHKSSPRVAGFVDALYVTELDNMLPIPITKHPDASDTHKWQGYLAAAPVWREDGKISFASKVDNNYDIYLTDQTGSDQQAITPKENNQVFHDWHDNGLLVFEASMDNHTGYDIYIKDLNGQITNLSNDEINQYAPKFVERTK